MKKKVGILGFISCLIVILSLVIFSDNFKADESEEKLNYTPTVKSDFISITEDDYTK